MHKTLNLLLFLCLLGLSKLAFAPPTVFPTGTTIYDPDQAWNGYTVFTVLRTPAVIVTDMNGNVVKRWEGFSLGAGAPARVLPGGYVMATEGARPPHQESLAMVLRDFDDNELWRYDRNEQITNREGQTLWSSRQHHDWQRTDFPAGYYSPEFTPQAMGANTLLLTHTNHVDPKVAGVELEDDRLIEVNANGEIVWAWRAGDHIDEFRFDAEERAAIARAPGFSPGRASYDWFHINSATYVGPNKWYDAGDQRFAPENVIISSRQSSVIAVIARDGSVAWQLGPDFSRSEEEAAIRQIIGQHHAHFIPPGLPGAGNVIIFDNGGSSGYGDPSPIAPNGSGIYARATSRVVEIDPVTLELVWSYAAGPQFFSTNISGAQRLPNGNTLITEGAPGRVFEVTAGGDIVWEYMQAPAEFGAGPNPVYRAYRIPYDWIPQLDAPRETALVKPVPADFSVP